MFLLLAVSACGPVAEDQDGTDNGGGGSGGGTGGGGSSVYPTQMTGKTVTIDDMDGSMRIAMQTSNGVVITQGGKTYTGTYDYDLPTDSDTATANYSVTATDSTVLLISGRFVYSSSNAGVFVYVKTVDGTAFPEQYAPFTL